MPDFAILSCNREVGASGSFDHAGLVIGGRAYDIAAVIAIVIHDPGRKARGATAAAKAAFGAFAGTVVGRSLPLFGAGAIGAAVGAGAGAFYAEQTRKKTQAAIVLADGLVAVAEMDEHAAGAMLLVSRAVAAHHAQWGAPSPAALPAPEAAGGAMSAQALLAALPSTGEIAATTRAAIRALRAFDWPEIPNPFRR